jgi:imidazolonepropionase-like amidohydrolase
MTRRFSDPAKPLIHRKHVLLWLCVALSACAAAPTALQTPEAKAPPSAKGFPSPDGYPSTYKAPQAQATLIRGATVLTGTGERIDSGDVLIVDGRIKAVGSNLTAPAGARVIDAQGRWVTPGLIDVHSHLGVYPSPSVNATSDGNEATAAVTPNVWAEHSVWPMDPGFQAALEGGITTLQILPGSANLIGGRGVTLKNVGTTTYQAMKFPSAPQGLKMACGENPKRVYGSRTQAPMTLMGNVAGYRQAFANAQDYREQWEKYERELAAYNKDKGGKDSDETKQPVPPKRDLALETLVGAMSGDILVHIHCYRADEMVTMLDLSEEFSFKIAAFHHAVEAYKIADVLARKGVCAAEWADWWGFKMEAFDGIEENLALTDLPANGCAIVHSDSEEGIQRLNQEAGKAMSRGERAGLHIPPERAIRWLTANPAQALGITAQTGTLEPGKMGDVVIWNGTPFSVYALAQQVFIDGALVFDREHPSAHPRSDFLLGQPGEGAQP